MALPSVGGGYQIGDGNSNEVRLGTQGAPADLTNTATVTAAQLATGILSGTPTAAATYTLPTVALWEALITNAKTNSSFDFYVINLATTNTYAITLAAGTGWTMSGEVTVTENDGDDANSSGHFRARKTGSAAWTCYRIS